MRTGGGNAVVGVRSGPCFTLGPIDSRTADGCLRTQRYLADGSVVNDRPGTYDRPVTTQVGPPAADAARWVSVDPRLSAWRTFLVTHALVTRRLDEELQERHGLSLAEFDALLQLALAPAGRLRMNQLADLVVLSRSGVTRLIDRLQEEGWVIRRQCPSDARGAEAELTPRGAERLREATVTHLAGVQRYFLDHLTEDELATLERALRRIGETLRSGGTWQPTPLSATAGDR